MIKCIYWLIKTVAQKEFIEGKTVASVNMQIHLGSQSDQFFHCLQSHLHLLDTILADGMTLLFDI